MNVIFNVLGLQLNECPGSQRPGPSIPAQVTFRSFHDLKADQTLSSQVKSPPQQQPRGKTSFCGQCSTGSLPGVTVSDNSRPLSVALQGSSGHSTHRPDCCEDSTHKPLPASGQATLLSRTWHCGQGTELQPIQTAPPVGEIRGGQLLSCTAEPPFCLLEPGRSGIYLISLLCSFLPQLSILMDLPASTPYVLSSAQLLHMGD